MSDDATTLQQPHPELLMDGVQRWVTLPQPLPDGVTRLAIYAGEIVGTVDVVRCLPIQNCHMGSHVCRLGDVQLLHHEHVDSPGDTEFDISDQFPFADWSPGRWAVEVTNPARALDGEA